MTLTTIERRSQAGDYGFKFQSGDRQFALKYVYVVILPNPSRIILGMLPQIGRRLPSASLTSKLLTL